MRRACLHGALCIALPGRLAGCDGLGLKATNTCCTHKGFPHEYRTLVQRPFSACRHRPAHAGMGLHRPHCLRPHRPAPLPHADFVAIGAGLHLSGGAPEHTHPCPQFRLHQSHFEKHRLVHGFFIGLCTHFRAARLSAGHGADGVWRGQTLWRQQQSLSDFRHRAGRAALCAV